MAIDALSIPFDIPWTRIAWSRDMLDRTRGGAAPPKWRSSMAVYGYAVPLEETELNYPDSRIVYLKVSASITGWSESEGLEDDALVLTPDEWQADAWDSIVTSWEVSEYWPCLCAFVQLSLHPRPADGVADDDYPYVMDFEPKKRELYEAATDSKELLSASSGRLSTQKGVTSTSGTEETFSAQAGFSGFGISVGGSTSERTFSNRQTVNMTTTDASTERRETQGYSTQLSQMYQLFNGYHLGTNRAVFAIFARPHTKTDDENGQLANNLINGERKLEGIQDMFLVIHLPRTMPGFCLDAWIDTGHKLQLRPSIHGTEPPTPLVLTRRLIVGCADFEGDRLRIAPPSSPPGPRVAVVGEAVIEPDQRFQHQSPAAFARAAKGNLVAAIDQLNIEQAEVQRAALASQTSTRFPARRYHQTAAFRQRAARALRANRTSIAALRRLGYLDAEDETALITAGINSAGDLFGEPNKESWPPVALTIRERLLDALIKALKPKS